MGNCHARFGAGENLEGTGMAACGCTPRPKDYLSLSYEMVPRMEKKRLGLCSKTLIVVPNHLTEQMASEALLLYPNAEILVAKKTDFKKENRKKFCARIATGNYDIIVIGTASSRRSHFRRNANRCTCKGRSTMLLTKSHF